LDALDDAPRTGRPPLIPLSIRCEVVQLACDRPDGSKVPFRDRWTLGSLRSSIAQQTGWLLSKTEIRRILRDEQLRPHRVRMWLHSPDPGFRRKVRAICDLYCQPPKRATVLCIDEKTGMQALERTHPFRPARPGRDGRLEFEYKRHGTRALIAAFDTQTGRVFARCGRKRREKDLLRFMEALAKPKRAACTSCGTTSTSTRRSLEKPTVDTVVASISCIRRPCFLGHDRDLVQHLAAGAQARLVRLRRRATARAYSASWILERFEARPFRWTFQAAGEAPARAA
jgi:hypothetical protein